MAMRLPVIILVSAFLSACASTSPNTSQSIKTADKKASQLSPGQCGFFGWSTGDTREFIFYADRKTARYDGASGPVSLTAKSAFPATEYTDPSGNSVTLRLGEGEVMDGGMRYPMARIVTLTDEGWERLHPLAIIRTCQPN